MSDGKISDDDIETIRKTIRVELKDELGPWLQQRFYLLAAVVTLLGVVGLYAVVQALVGDKVRNRLEASKEDVRTFRAEALTATADAKSAATEARRVSADEVNRARAAVAEAVAQAKSAANLANQAAQEAQNALKLAGAARTRAEEVGRQLDQIAQPRPDTLSEADQRAIRIRQTPRPTGTKTSSGHPITELTFKVEVDTAVAEKPAAQILAHLEKVNYVFDERWFDPPLRTVTDPTSRFAFVMRVWGVTRVNAAIHLLDPRKILTREGLMNLNEPSLLSE